MADNNKTGGVPRQTIEVVGAYGRNYKTLADAKKDWDADKDFQMTTGPYVNKTDAKTYKISDVVVRYGTNQTKVGKLKDKPDWSDSTS